MSEYTPFSQIMDGDGDGTWDENLSGSRTETKDDSKPSLIPLGTNSLPEAAPAEELPERKPKHEAVTISTIEVEAEDQTIVSKISITSLRSRTGCFEMPTVLCENSSLDEGDVSEITEMRMEKPRPKAKKKDNVCVSLLNSCTGDRPLKMPSYISKKVQTCQGSTCVSEKCVQYPSILDAYSPSLFEEIIPEEDEIVEVAEPPKQETPKDSDEAKTEAKTTEPEKPAAPPKTAENGKSSNDTVATKHVEQKSVPYNICFNGVTEPMTSIAEMLTSASNHFTSSSLSVDGDCSVLFISANGDAQKQIVSAPTEMSAITLESPKSAREQVRPADRSLFDIMSHTSVIDEEDRTITTIGENITEGLGLDLPPTPLPARPLATPKAPKIEDASKTEDAAKTEDSNEATPEPEIADTDADSTDMARIEVDASGTILLEDSMNRDVYISYQIEVIEHDNESTTESEDIPSPILPPKTPSPSRKSLKPRWPKLFSSNKTKKNKKDNENNGIVKPASTKLCDSPGSATVGTAETQMTMRTYATLTFAEDHPVNPRKHPFFLRPRSATKA
mmetsp:Transcript_12620/g.31793  ORF Transcript_12620/g.31793 Transcript_12620/m.31793 type:complete len:561 (-) Transcript_12620:1446-3128(-)|eukprot:CAMPEP_0116088348 /NCGR_PEP_ID=MMETSP0327-20121206/5824_1 /TAXON_ID=44447 /ORGANISM="Pseudo-nitzschia delicatissima, Strain B596" /LENGTH=560 /DNA_ID=CAMNT_0003579427 /DNA_START=89 /DNA_END=1771 /DNA_ORIENTATION=-